MIIAQILCTTRAGRFLFLPQSAPKTPAHCQPGARTGTYLAPMERNVSRKPEIYAALEVGSDGAASTAALQAILESGVVACLLLRAPVGRAIDASVTKRLASMAQKRGVATLIADDADLARMLKADGLHISWSKDPIALYREARSALGEHAMIGVDAGRSRDDAMVLGEAGADYVAFGIPAHVADRETAEERQRDLISWWADIVEVPCVAFDVAVADGARAVAQAGADFVVVTLTESMSTAEVTAALKDYASAIAPSAPVTA
jgi:thiamine-phosphate pyrophosphorylase